MDTPEKSPATLTQSEIDDINWASDQIWKFSHYDNAGHKNTTLAFIDGLYASARRNGGNATLEAHLLSKRKFIESLNDF